MTRVQNDNWLRSVGKIEVDQNALNELAAVARLKSHRAFAVWRKLTEALVEVIRGNRDVETAFNDIPIRDCLPQYTVLATTWSIDDLREYFPYGTPDEELYENLRKLEKRLANAAVLSGNEVIEDEFDDDIDNEVIIQVVWAVKDPETGYGDIYGDEQEAIMAHGAENIIKGFSITGGHSVRPYLEEHFRDFYDNFQELVDEIRKHDGLDMLLSCEGALEDKELLRMLWPEY